MARKTYEHSAYWYAKNCGWTRSDRASHVERLLDEVRRDLKFGGGRVDGNLSCDPLGFGVCLAVCTAMDIGAAMRETARALADPAERDRMRRELLRDLRAVRRPFYYARETARRRALAAERRKITRRTTLAPEPTPADVLAAWGRRKDSKEDMIRLGGMLHDLECYVDNALRFDANGDVVGRNGGIRGWLKENLPELFPKYKTLMRYKAMAIRLRQATGTKDPTPTSALLGDGIGGANAADRTSKTDGTRTTSEPSAPNREKATGRGIATGKGNAADAKRPARGASEMPHEVVRELLKDFRMTFSSLEEGLAQRLDPERVFLDAAKPKRTVARGMRGTAAREKRRTSAREKRDGLGSSAQLTEAVRVSSPCRFSQSRTSRTAGVSRLQSDEQRKTKPSISPCRQRARPNAS